MRKKLLIGMLLLLPVISTGIEVQASQTSGSVPVTYTKEYDDMYALVIRVKGNGSVSDGKKLIRNTSNYLLKIDEMKVFTLHPDQSEKVVDVLLDGISIRNQIEDQQIKIKGITKAQELEVIFTSSANKPNGKPTDAPNTGDQTSYPWVMLMASFIAVMILLERRSKKNRE